MKLPRILSALGTRDRRRFEDMTFFLGLGPTKTGTTWLHEYLYNHPEFYETPLKESHFFSSLHHLRNAQRYRKRTPDKLARLLKDPELLEAPAKQDVFLHWAERLNMADNPDRYMAYFRRHVGPQHKAFGEISPSYCALSSEGYRLIRNLHPAVRVTICLRDPISRVDAVLRHFWKHDNRMPYAKFVDHRLSMRLEYHNFFYDRLLDRLFEVFEESEVRVQFFEDMFNQPALDAITDFIGIAPRPGNFDRRLAHSPPAEQMTGEQRDKLCELLAPTYAAIRERFGDRVPDSWAM